MNGVAAMMEEEREELFHETAAVRNMTDRMVEKDFWVCWSLKQLFEAEALPASLLFKGGTSLSKAFGAIARFSEDIDLSLNRKDLNVIDDAELECIENPNRVAKRLKKLREACAAAVQDQVRPLLEQKFATVLGDHEIGSWLISDPQDADNATLLFHYPTSIEEESSESAGIQDEYLIEVVRLEFGARSDHWPKTEATVRPYAAEEFPQVFRQPQVTVSTLAPERTFLEKLTELHNIACTPDEKRTRERQSRHYYDVLQLLDRGIGERALADRQLVVSVAKHKNLFFHSKGVDYHDVCCGRARFVPSPPRREQLRADYEKTLDHLLFGPAPPWEDVLSRLADLEARVNERFGSTAG